MQADFDGIILGAGHHGLILQAYCGLAGLKVVCLERSSIAGGGLSTLEDPRHPGFWHNTHSFFHRAMTHMPWYRDLELEDRGVRYLEPALNASLVLKDGRSLNWWTDFEKTYESFAAMSKADADEMRRWRDAFVPIVTQIVAPEGQSPPVPPARRRELLERNELGRRLLEVSAMSPLEFVTTYFKHPAVQAGLLFFNGLREVDLRCKGFGHHIPLLLASSGKAQMCVGGAAALARGLVDAVNATGGTILLNTQPQRIVVEDGKAVGVELADGRRLRAKHFVASGLNPHQTFLDLMSPDDVPAAWRDKAAGFQYNLIAPLFGLNLNLREAPVYTAAEQNAALTKPFMVILGLEHFEQYPQIVAHHQAGTIPPTVMWGCCPTQHDPSQAPPGGHVAFMWEKLPYKLQGDPANWDAQREAHGRDMLDLWTQHAPNLRDATIDWFVRSPLDVERAFPNMREGDLLIGAFTNNQIGYDRPFAGAGHYRAHVEGLYLCGSACHPGGNITGLAGYNCAQVLLSDLNMQQPWFPPPIEKRLESLPCSSPT